MALTNIPIKAYRKEDLCILLLNPSLDLSDEVQRARALPMTRPAFSQLCKERLKDIPETEWKRKKVLSEDIVRVLLTG